MLLLAALTLNSSFSDSPVNASSSLAERESAEHAILDFAESELIIPTGHGGFANPEALAEIARILKLNRLEE
jgi:hypothetical protein